MITTGELSPLRETLQDRRRRLDAAVAAGAPGPDLGRLIEEVDAALARMQQGTYGACETCHEPIETDRLIADPLLRFCLDHLTPREQKALEDDLALASRIQRGLLPTLPVATEGWDAAYWYEPLGAVSGDYCDLIALPGGDLYFILGDVSGKGVAASMLMAHLHAMFRTLISLNLPLEEIMRRAARLFCESTLPTHYATLVCGRARRSGEVEVCNAGHIPPLVVTDRGVEVVAPGGLPLGFFCDESFSTTTLRVTSGGHIVLCTDGVTEGENRDGSDYGHSRLTDAVTAARHLDAAGLIARCAGDLAAFQDGAARRDDVTMMVLRRA